MNTYKTSSLTMAAYLLSTRKLRFIGCEGPTGNSRIVVFCFADPNGEGDALYTEFLLGPCNAFYDSIKVLRKMIQERVPDYSRYV